MSEELKPANQHPDFGKICVHGSLKRKCYTCELEEQCSDFEKQLSLERQRSKVLVEALEKIRRVELDPELGWIVKSESYEKAWLDCVEIAEEALKKYEEMTK